MAKFKVALETYLLAKYSKYLLTSSLAISLGLFLAKFKNFMLTQIGFDVFAAKAANFKFAFKVIHWVALNSCCSKLCVHSVFIITQLLYKKVDF